jgi:hypothetical protein
MNSKRSMAACPAKRPWLGWLWPHHGMVIELLLGDIAAEAAGDILRNKGHRRVWDLLEAHAPSAEDIAAQLLAHRKID